MRLSKANWLLIVGMAILLGVMLTVVMTAPAELVYRIGVGIALYALLVNTFFWGMSMVSSKAMLDTLAEIRDALQKDEVA